MPLHCPHGFARLLLPAAVTCLSQSDDDYDPEWAPKRRSSWRWPIMGFALTAVMAAAILLYYFGPRPAEVMGTAFRPTAASDPVAVKVGSVSLVIPANYILLPNARNGGAMDEIELAALMPDLHGFKAGDDAAFDDVSDESRVMRILIRSRANALSERDRFDRWQRDGAVMRAEETGPAGLTVWRFDPDSGAGGTAERLFVFDGEGTFALYRCTPAEDGRGATYCSRWMPVGTGVRANYRFTQKWLADWRALDERVDKLLRSFALVRP